jgi:hypothetical protein
VRRFRAFFAGRHSAKESATRFRANLSTVSWVRVGADVEGCACADKVGKDSKWVVTVVEFKAAVEDSGSDGPGSTLRNPFSTICGFAA